MIAISQAACYQGHLQQELLPLVLFITISKIKRHFIAMQLSHARKPL
jgi:hypothetical protein